jgi:ADP-heptose:LPS heptosyltransferase
VAGFRDRFEPLRQIVAAAGVITADTFAAHLAGLSGTPTYTIYNFAYQPRWCEYWGAPFANVLHFEKGNCFSVKDDFHATSTSENSVLFGAALRASERVAQNVQAGFAAQARCAA